MRSKYAALVENKKRLTKSLRSKQEEIIEKSERWKEDSMDRVHGPLVHVLSSPLNSSVVRVEFLCSSSCRRYRGSTVVILVTAPRSCTELVGHKITNLIHKSYFTFSSPTYLNKKVIFQHSICQLFRFQMSIKKKGNYTNAMLKEAHPV